MPAWPKYGFILSFAAALVVLSVPAAADQPSAWSQTPKGDMATMPAAGRCVGLNCRSDCQPAPTNPRYSYDKSTCCVKPNIWQEQCVMTGATANYLGNCSTYTYICAPPYQAPK